MADGPKGHLVFACGGGLYAVPADRASEVVNLPPLTRVPGAGPHLLGVFAHRGEVLPVIDLSRLVGKPVEEEFKRVVVVRVTKGTMASPGSARRARWPSCTVRRGCLRESQRPSSPRGCSTSSRGGAE
jgi:hypothetical protein